jgi:hypothetical protein
MNPGRSETSAQIMKSNDLQPTRAIGDSKSLIDLGFETSVVEKAVGR